jgi:phosphoglycerate kinase
MIRSIKDVPLSRKAVIVRCDLNVPVKNGKIIDKSRIIASIPTIKYLLNQDAKVIICSHFGRPDGKYNPDMSLKLVCDELSSELEREIYFTDKYLDEEEQKKILDMPYPSCIILENLRFHKEEDENNHDFAKKIAQIGNIYINDAFACSHRAHASIEAITHYLPSFGGLNLINEVDSISKIFLQSVKENTIAIVGGSKISTKIDLLNNLVKKCSYIVVGGGMANTFLKAKGYNIGKSMYEEKYLQTAKDIMNKNECEIFLPSDVLVAKSIGDNVLTERKDIANISDDDIIVDFGSESIKKTCNAIDEKGFIIFNGPVGIYEIENFSQGSISIAKQIASTTKNKGARSIVGGGDAVACINKAKVFNDISFVSTAGGAFLEFIEGKNLPGIERLCGHIDL